MYKMRIISRDGETVIATIKWSEGGVVHVDGSDRIKSQFDIWIRHGLEDWVGERGDRKFRVTDYRDPEFLPRAAEVIRRQGGFSVSMQKDA